MFCWDHVLLGPSEKNWGGSRGQKTCLAYMKVLRKLDQPLFTECKKLFPLSRYLRSKFQKYKGFYGKFQLQMAISRNHENLCLRRMKHAGKVIFGQVGDILVSFKRKVPDFRFFDFLRFYGPKSVKFEENSQNAKVFII